MSFARSIYLLFISVIQIINEGQFLNIILLFLLFAAAAAPVFLVPLTNMYTSL